MKLQLILAAAVIGMAAGSSFAAISVTVDGGTDVGGGLTKYVLTAHSNDGTYGVSGFDVTITGSTGNLNQVHPAGLDTPFQDLNALMSNDMLDTQFMFNASDVLVAPDTTNDNTLQLTSAFTTAPTAYANVDFAQVVVPTGTSFMYSADLALSDANATVTHVEGTVPVPEPASLGLLALGGAALLRRKR